jgi:hypothetical protein
VNELVVDLLAGAGKVLLGVAIFLLSIAWATSPRKEKTKT